MTTVYRYKGMPSHWVSVEPTRHTLREIADLVPDFVERADGSLVDVVASERDKIWYWATKRSGADPDIYMYVVSSVGDGWVGDTIQVTADRDDFVPIEWYDIENTVDADIDAVLDVFFDGYPIMNELVQAIKRDQAEEWEVSKC